jgi:hypothetical protein
MAKSVYRIRKTIIEEDISVFMKDSSRDILEFNDFNEASEFYKMMNANSSSNYRYHIWETKKIEE